MGFFSGLFGGGGSKTTTTTTSTTNLTTNTDVSVLNDFSALAEVEQNRLNFEKDFFEYIQEMNKQNLTAEELKAEKEEFFRLAQLEQSEKQLKLQEKNTNLTVFFTVIGIFFTWYYSTKKGKK